MLFLRWIGWGVAFAAVVAFSLITTITCFNFGKMSALFSSDPDRNALIFAAVDIAKMVLPVGIVWCWAKAHYAACAASVIAFVVFLSASLFAAFGISANVASSKEAGAVIASSRLSGLQAQLQRLTPELAALGTPRPVDQIAADIARHKINDKWAASSGCDERKIVGGTLNYCQRLSEAVCRTGWRQPRSQELRAKTSRASRPRSLNGTTTTAKPHAREPRHGRRLAKLIDIDAGKDQRDLEHRQSRWLSRRSVHFSRVLLGTRDRPSGSRVAQRVQGRLRTPRGGRETARLATSPSRQTQRLRRRH